MERKNTIKPWPMRKRAIQIRVDPDFRKFILDEFPNANSDSERTRTLLDRLLYGKKKR